MYEHSVFFRTKLQSYLYFSCVNEGFVELLYGLFSFILCFKANKCKFPEHPILCKLQAAVCHGSNYTKVFSQPFFFDLKHKLHCITFMPKI